MARSFRRAAENDTPAACAPRGAARCAFPTSEFGFKEHWDFEWQEGYGAFSIGISGVEDTTKYIQGQAEHHRKTTFKEEIEVFLKKHGMEYVERDLE